jgi:hypothetical protein
VSLTLTALDAAFEAPDVETITRVLRSLGGDRVSIATLGRSDSEYVQARGSVREGFTLEYQAGSIDQRYRSREGAVSLEHAIQVFHRYAQGDARWREGTEWEAERVEVPRTGWTGTWFGFAILVVIVSVLIWLWRGW